MTTRKLMIAEAIVLALILANPAWAQTEDIYISASGSGTAGSVSFDDEDIVLCDRSGGVGTCAWTMFFDGSTEGIGKAGDLTAFHVIDDDNILMAFKTPKKIGNLKKVDDSDIVHFDGAATPSNAYQFFFDGSNVGLTDDDESIDAMGFDVLGRLVISTDGDYSVPMTGGGTLTGGDEDLIVFNGTTGPATAGAWELYFDGSDVGFNSPQEDIAGTWIDDNTDEIYLTTRGDFSAGLLTGGGTDIFICDPLTLGLTTTCNFSGFFVAADEGFEDKIIDGIFIFNNDPPLAQDDLFNMLEDGPALNGNVLADNGNGIDDDPDGDPLTVNTTPISGPSNGSLTLLANGNFTYTPDADYYGTDMFEYEIDDGNGGTDIGKVTITVDAVNDQPTFTAVDPPAVDEDSGPQNVLGWAAFDPGPANESGQSVLTYIVSNVSNPSLFAAGPTVNTSGDLSYTSAVDAFGTSTFDVQVQDDGGTANGGVDLSTTQTFTITVDAVNDQPTFTAVDPPAVDEDSGPQGVPGWATFDPGPANESGQSVLQYNVSNVSNPSLFDAGPTVNTSGDLSYTSAADAFGTSTFDVQVQDDGGTPNGGVDLSTIQTFTITVDAVNDQPSFTAVDPPAVDEDSGPQGVPGWATFDPGPANESGQSVLQYNVSNVSNPSLFDAGPTVNTSGDLSYTSAADAFGTSTFDVQVQDDGGTPNGGVDLSTIQTFTITVDAVNDQPSFTAVDPPAVDEDSGPQGVPGWATFDPGPANESGQSVLQYNVSNVSNPSLFDAGPTVNTSGDLSYTSAADAFGTSTFDVQVQDDGGTPNGGVDLSTIQTFTITVNDTPETDAMDDLYTGIIGNVGLDVSAGNGVLSNDLGGATTVTEVNGAGANVGTATSTTHGTVTVQADGSFLYEPNAGNLIADSFTYEADGVDTATVDLNFGSDMIWFIDTTPVGAGNVGTLSDPFNSISGYNASSAGTGEEVFIAAGGYMGPLNLNNNSVVIGEGATGTTATLLGVTLPSIGSRTLPSVGGTAPSITSLSDGINLATGNTIRGLNIGDNGGTGFRGTAVGTLNISEVAIGDGTPSGGGIEVATSGTLAITLDSLSANSSTDEGIRLNGVSGTFAVTDTTGTIATTNVPAIDIDGNTSLAATMTFASVSADGGPNGINLEDVTGSFTVSGTGTAGSGGTIQNMGGADGATSGSGIRLSNAQNISLNWMQINDHSNFAIRGLEVSGFSLDDSVVDGTNGNSTGADEGSIRFTNLTGTVNFAGSTIEGGHEDNIRIDNSVDKGTAVLDMTVEDSGSNGMVIGLNNTTFGNDGILLETTGNSEATLDIDGVDFLGARGDMIQTNALGTSTQDITISDSTFDNVHSNIVSGGGGITLSGGSGTSDIDVDYVVENSVFSGAEGNAITANFLSHAGTADGVIQGNTIGTGTPGSGSAGGSGILVGAEKNGALNDGDIIHTVLIDDNTIRGVDGFAGIEVISNKGDASNRAEVNATITNNDVAGLGGFALSAMYLLTGGSAGSGDFAQVCADVRGNVALDASGSSGAGNAVYFDQLSSDANHNLPGYTGSANGEFSAIPGTASFDIDSFLVGLGNSMTNGPFPLFVGGVDANNVLGVTGAGTTCP